MRGRTVYVRIKGRPEIERRLEADSIASAGPYPNIAGMRQKYWGKDCLIIKAGIYAYNMGKDTGQAIPY